MKRVRELLWPRAGWRRTSTYLFHRMARMQGSAYSIAAGFACGAAISFTPLLSLHLVLAAAWAWLIRGNLFAAWIGTLIGNPWTFPFIWVATYKLGLLMGAAGRKGKDPEDFTTLFVNMWNAILNLDFAYLWHHAWPLWFPMMIGSIPFLIVSWFAFYLPLRPMLAAYQRRRRARYRGHHPRHVR